MNKTTHIFLVVVFFMFGCTTGQVSKTIDGLLGGGQGLSNEEVVAGLKEALIKGITKGAQSASSLNGYFKNPLIKIPVPDEMKQVESRLRAMGLDKEVDRFIMTLNRGAEEAAKEAAPIFITAIKSMTVRDAWDILSGDNDAATQYLKRTTLDELKEKFEPVISRSLAKVNATRYYGEIVSTYNKIPLVDKLNPDLNDYATDKAVEGLFKLVAQEEANIRTNPAARTTELLKKVFGRGTQEKHF